MRFSTRLLCAAAAVASLVVFCIASAAASNPVRVTRGVAYADTTPAPAWTSPTMDVYAPTGARDLPLVVFLVPHSLETTSYPVHALLARAVAKAGAVVAVASWSDVANGADTARTIKVALERFNDTTAMAACAVSFAVSTAARYGANPSRLILAGHAYGANTASILALGTHPPYADCRTHRTGWKAKALVGWDGDWLALYPAWDRFGKASSQVVAAITPWQVTATASRIPLTFVTTDAFAPVTNRCDVSTAQWLAWRDPTGEMRARLNKTSALADDCVNIAEEAQVMAAKAADHGFTVNALHLTGKTSSDARLTPADLNTLAKTIADVGRATRRISSERGVLTLDAPAS